MKNQPKPPSITVVITTFKRPHLLRRLLRSLVRQTRPPQEVIVVDDASPGKKEYAALIREFQGKIRNLKYLRNPVNRGLCYSRNRGILAARNPLIAMSDDDDEWMPRKLEQQALFLMRHWNQCDMVCNWLLIKDEKGLVLSRFKGSLKGGGVGAFLSDISGSVSNVSGTLIKRDCLLQTGLFDERLPACEDWDMWLRILQKGYHCRQVEGFLTIVHVQRTGMSNSFVAKRGFFLLAVKHFRLFLKVKPVVFLHLAWFSTGLKFGLRNKFGKFLGIKKEA